MKLTKEHAKYIQQALADGKSYREIAKELGCHHSTVALFVKVNFPELRRRPQGAGSPVIQVDTSSLKLLVIDIETRPSLAYVWDVWQQNVSPRQIIEEKETISWAAKWIGSDEVMFMSVYHDGKDAMVQEAWNLLDAADGVIGYNSKKFDVKHLNTEFWRAGMTPPSPFRHIDLLQTVKGNFMFTHNKLDNVAEKVGIGNKIEHEGFALWLKCMRGDGEAWERMKAYNMQDVVLTEALYYKILPWITNHPSYAAVTGDKACPNCGSSDLKAAGHQFTKTRRYQRYLCGNCGKYSRDTHCDSSAEITETSSW